MTNLQQDLLTALEGSQFALESVFHLTGNRDVLPQIQANAAIIAKAKEDTK